MFGENLTKAKKKNKLKKKKKKKTHYVPTTLLVLAMFWFSRKILAIPKSDILATISLSNNTLLGFRSL